MLILDAWSPADLQNVLHFLRAAEGAGVTDPRALSVAIDRNLTARRLESRRQRLESSGRSGRPKPPVRRPEPCPSCGRVAVVRMDVEGLTIDTCRACRWSRPVDTEGRI